jgi:hypothetical protein
MNPRTPRAAVALLSLGAAIACTPTAPSRNLHQWTDAEGNVRYTAHTERIPPLRRADASVVAEAPEDTHGQYWLPAEGESDTAGDSGEAESEAREPLGSSVDAAPPEAETPLPVAVEPDPGPGPEIAPVEPAPAEVGDVPPPDESPLDARIRALEAEVASDQETLKALIADPDSAAGLRASPELRELSERLPRLQAELRALRAQRDAEPAATEGEGDGA